MVSGTILHKCLLFFGGENLAGIEVRGETEGEAVLDKSAIQSS